jgi:hypothetical protein
MLNAKVLAFVREHESKVTDCGYTDDDVDVAQMTFIPCVADRSLSLT